MIHINTQLTVNITEKVQLSKITMS